jgi:mono/diheme cytochrome c family protein
MKAVGGTAKGVGGTMKIKLAILAVTLALGSFGYDSLAHAEGPAGKKDAASSPVAPTYDVDAMRVQGELRYRANCGRCHAAPRKFPPRMMATVLRHMRVRATITDEDMRLVLFYMTQ